MFLFILGWIAYGLLRANDHLSGFDGAADVLFFVMLGWTLLIVAGILLVIASGS